MSKQHDVNQCSSLPKEDFTAQTKHHGGAVYVGSCDGHSDQRHHSGLMGLQLIEKSRQERIAAVKKHKAGKHKQEDGIPGKFQPATKSDPFLNHVRKKQNRYGDCQADPEPLPKIFDHMCMMIVMCLLH